MTDKANQPIHITGEERPHLAVRKLGRAFIALARHQLGMAGASSAQAAPTGGSAEPAASGTDSRAVNRPEVSHD